MYRWSVFLRIGVLRVRFWVSFLLVGSFRVPFLPTKVGVFLLVSGFGVFLQGAGLGVSPFAFRRLRAYP